MSFRAYSNNRLQFLKPGMKLVPEKGSTPIKIESKEAYFEMEPGKVYDIPEWILDDPVTGKPAPLFEMAMRGGVIHEVKVQETVPVPKDRPPTEDEVQKAKQIIAMAEKAAGAAVETAKAQEEAKPASAKPAEVPAPDAKSEVKKDAPAK